MLQVNASRKFRWVSSIDRSHEGELRELDERMSNYYNQSKTRHLYQEMISGEKDTKDPVTEAFANWLLSKDLRNLLEIGCGTGRIWDRLFRLSNQFNYTGVEVSSDILFKNSEKWPNQQWINSNIYDLNLEPQQYDCVFSFYVLEHLTQPYTALEKMMQFVAPGGYLVVVCPDFVASGRFPSQHIGFSKERRAKNKLLKGRFVDSLVRLYDSRIRLPLGLKGCVEPPGRFMVNINPACLHYEDDLWPDIDAVYIANRSDIQFWAKGNNLTCSFPNESQRHFKEHIFCIIRKPLI